MSREVKYHNLKTESKHLQNIVTDHAVINK